MDNEDLNKDINEKLINSIHFILNGVEETYKDIYDISFIELDIGKYC
jgi:site-specific DNA-adenine methylase